MAAWTNSRPLVLHKLNCGALAWRKVQNRSPWPHGIHWATGDKNETWWGPSGVWSCQHVGLVSKGHGKKLAIPQFLWIYIITASKLDQSNYSHAHQNLGLGQGTQRSIQYISLHGKWNLDDNNISQRSRGASLLTQPVWWHPCLARSLVPSEIVHERDLCIPLRLLMHQFQRIAEKTLNPGIPSGSRQTKLCLHATPKVLRS